MSRGDVGDYLGLTLETVSRTLSRFRKSGLIEIPNAHLIVLTARKELTEIAEGW